jgi:hypothetical protein
MSEAFILFNVAVVTVEWEGQLLELRGQWGYCKYNQMLKPK